MRLRRSTTIWVLCALILVFLFQRAFLFPPPPVVVTTTRRPALGNKKTMPPRGVGRAVNMKSSPSVAPPSVDVAPLDDEAHAAVPDSTAVKSKPLLTFEFSMSPSFQMAWKTKSERLTFEEQCRFQQKHIVVGAKEEGQRRSATGGGGHGNTNAAVSCSITFYGKSSLKLTYTSRRSVQVELSQPIVLDDGTPWQRFLLLSLWEDKSRLAYKSSVELLQSLGLFFAATRYVAVHCQSEGCPASYGVYMMVEEPVSAIHRRVDDVLNGRALVSEPYCSIPRPSMHDYVAKSPLDIGTRNWFYFEKPANYDLLHVPSYKRNSSLTGFYRLVEANLDAAAAGSRGMYFDATAYMAWIAVNTLLQNGDYDDEVFFFSAGQYVGIMAWDYDNVFSPCHRKGKQAVKTPHMYCAETPIEKHILKTPSLLKSYQDLLQCLASDRASPDVFKQLVFSSAAELKAFLMVPAIAKATFDTPQTPNPFVAANELAEQYAARCAMFSEGGRPGGRSPPQPKIRQDDQDAGDQGGGEKAIVLVDGDQSPLISKACESLRDTLNRRVNSEYKWSASRPTEYLVQSVFSDDPQDASELTHGMYCAAATTEQCNVSKVFVVRSKERGKAEFGLTHFQLPSDVPVTPAEASDALAVRLPRLWPERRPIPVVLQASRGGKWLRGNLRVALSVGDGEGGAAEATPLKPSIVPLARGIGSFFIGKSSSAAAGEEGGGARGPVFVDVAYGLQVAFDGDSGSGKTKIPMPMRVQIAGAPSFKATEISIGKQFNHDAQAGDDIEQQRATCVRIIRKSAVIAASHTMTIQRGCALLFEGDAQLTVLGVLTIEGTEDEPVVIAPAADNSLFRSILVKGPSGRMSAKWLFVSGAGAGKPHPGTGTHHVRGAAFTLADSGASWEGDHVYILDSAGPAFACGPSTSIAVSNSVVHYAQLGIECIMCDFTTKLSHWANFPDATSHYEDNDNDAMYLSGGSHLVADSVIANCKDDGIDSGSPEKHIGDAGALTVVGTIVERIQHEGIAFSGAPNARRAVFVRDSLITVAQQGVEMGYSGERNEAHVSNCEFRDNLVAVRYGDNYHGRPLKGRLTVTKSRFLNNVVDVINYVRDLKGPASPKHRFSVEESWAVHASERRAAPSGALTFCPQLRQGAIGGLTSVDDFPEPWNMTEALLG